VLQGRQAGRKVVVIKQLDEGTKERPYPHAIVAGIERYPRKVTKRMGKKKVSQRSKVKPFIKVSTFFSFLPRSALAANSIFRSTFFAVGPYAMRSNGDCEHEHDEHLIDRPSTAPTSSPLATHSNSRDSRASVAQRPSKSPRNERMQRRR
jgi:hypothetical protein